jgi:hypothetical protein
MSDSDTAKREEDPARGGSRNEAAGDPAPEVMPAGPAELPSMFLQIVGAVAIGLLAVVAAQSFLTARDVNVVSQNVGTLAGRLQAETDKSRKLFDEVVILRGQVGELRNFLQVTSRQSSGRASGETPPGPADWTGVYVSELAPLLPILAQYEGDMGEAWIYTDNQSFIESIARALEKLEADGAGVKTDQPQ